MALKYFSDYFDVSNVAHRIEILQMDTNLVSNGDFLTINYWIAGGTWAIDVGNGWAKNTGNGTQAILSQTTTKYLSGVTYRVTFSILAGGVGSVNFAFENEVGGLQQGAFRSGVGTYVEDITLTEDRKTFRLQGDFDIEDVFVTDVIVKEVFDAPIEIGAVAMLDYSSTDKSLESVRGQGLSIQLDASEDLTFEDLFSEFERSYKVIYYRDSEILFVGWLNIEGIFQDYVSDKWIITLDCVDGLGYLEDLSYVDLNGFPYLGRQKELDIIQRCLLRTGLDLNINTSIDIYYTGLPDTVNVLENVYLNGGRFRRDVDTIMSCEQVLRDLLQPYGAVITSHKGEWYIYKPNQIFNDASQTFFRYDYLGVALSPTTKIENFSQTLGSQLNGFYPHYAGGNQSMKLEASLGALRIYYGYGLKQSLLENTFLETLDGITIADWVVESLTNMTLPTPSGFGVTFVATDAVSVLNLSTVAITVPISFLSTFVFMVNHDSDLEDGKFRFQISFQETDPPQNTWYLNSAVEWSDGTNDINFFNIPTGSLSSEFGVEIPPVPAGGDIIVRIYTPTVLNVGGGTGVELIEVMITPTGAGAGLVVGEKFTFQRINRPTAKTADIIEVFNADNASDVYQGTIYKVDQVTPTETWYRKGITESLPLIVIMGIEIMEMNQNNSILFSGSVYGYIPYLSVVSLDGISGVFMFIEYSYDTRANVTSMVLRQIYDGFLETGVELLIEVGKDYGRTVKPTIKG